MKSRDILSWLLCIELALGATPMALAEGPSGLSNITVSDEIGTNSQGNEYVSGNYPGAILMPVNLWGAVPKPGIHHVPTKTDLLSLMSFAGGPSKDADLKEVTVKRRTSGKDEVIPVDLKNVITKPGQLNVTLEPNDIIMVPAKEDFVNNSSLKTATFASVIVGIVLTSLLIPDHFKRTPGQ